MKRNLLLSAVLGISFFANAEKILLPMDSTQTDHLRAYGIVFSELKDKIDVNWLLNYRGGSFLFESSDEAQQLCNSRGVKFELFDAKDERILDKQLADVSLNMKSVPMAHVPRIAVHAATSADIWEDAVVDVLQYAGIPFDTLSDEDILQGKLQNYDWLHVHHEDFTGQHGKFYTSYFNAPWYKSEVSEEMETANRLGYAKVSQMKLDVAKQIRSFVEHGGSFFAMCSATDSYDIAMASDGVDICDAVYDGDPMDVNANTKLNYDNCFAFTGFSLKTNNWEYEFSNIDTYETRMSKGVTEANDYFTLYDFSAAKESESCMLTQDHERIIKGFWGQTTAFDMHYVKPDVTVLANCSVNGEARYLHGDYGLGSWTYFGGHDPEDYQHHIGDLPTDISKFKNSPGYRLILNNALFASTKTETAPVVEVNTYPNPASDVLHVSYSGTDNNSVLTFSVYDATGKAVLEQQMNAGSDMQEVDITSLAPGVYIWRLNSNEAALRSETFTIVR